MGHRVPLFFSAALSMHRRNESVLEGTLVRGVYALLSPSLLLLLTSSPFLVAWSVPYTPRFFSAPRHRNRISVTRRPWVVGMPLCPKVPFLPLPLLFPSGFPPRFKSPRWGSVRFSARVVGFLNAGFRMILDPVNFDVESSFYVWQFVSPEEAPRVPSTLLQQLREI